MQRGRALLQLWVAFETLSPDSGQTLARVHLPSHPANIQLSCVEHLTQGSHERLRGLLLVHLCHLTSCVYVAKA